MFMKVSNVGHLKLLKIIKCKLTVKEMGIKFSIIDGETEVRYSDPKILNHFTKV